MTAPDKPTAADVIAWMEAHPREAWEVMTAVSPLLVGPWTGATGKRNRHVRGVVRAYHAHPGATEADIDDKLRSYGYILVPAEETTTVGALAPTTGPRFGAGGGKS